MDEGQEVVCAGFRLSSNRCMCPAIKPEAGARLAGVERSYDSIAEGGKRFIQLFQMRYSFGRFVCYPGGSGRFGQRLAEDLHRMTVRGTRKNCLSLRKQVVFLADPG